MAGRFPKKSESYSISLVDPKNIDQMIKQLFNSVIAKYRDLSVSCRSIIYLSLPLGQIIDLLAKSRYFFAQPCSIIVNDPTHFTKKEYLLNFRTFKFVKSVKNFSCFLINHFR